MTLIVDAPPIIPNQLSLRMDTRLIRTGTTYSLPVAIIATILAYLRAFNNEPPTIDISHLTTPIEVSVSDGKNIYAGDLIIGFYKVLATGERGDDIAFRRMCSFRDSIPYYFPSTVSTLRCVVAVRRECHNKAIPHAVYQRITTPLDPVVSVTKLTN